MKIIFNTENISFLAWDKIINDYTILLYLAKLITSPKLPSKTKDLAYIKQLSKERVNSM